MTSRDAADFELMRAAQLLEADPAAAAERARGILTAFPGHPEASLLLAGAQRRLGDPGAALAVLESLPPTQLESAFLQLELGRTHQAHGQEAEAIAAYRRAVALDPGLADAWQELAAALFQTTDTRAGDAAYARFIQLRGDPPELRDAALALGENRVEAADALLRRRIEDAPRDAAAMRMLAEVAVLREDYEEAERRLTACLDLAPGYVAARYDLAHLLHTLHRDEEALPLIERVLGGDPQNLDYLSLKAQVLRMIERNEDAVALMEQAVAAHPTEDRAWALFGHLLREIGQQARAIEKYRQALAVRPASGRAYASLANLKTFRFTSEDRAAMQDQLARPGLARSDRTQLEFALGKALEDEGEYESSFQHYARGNALQRAAMRHDPEAMTKDVQRLQSLYTTRFFAERAGWGSTRTDPIFIVGLPRSGSTLLEQVLASHSQVEGTRELPDVPAIAFELMSDPRFAGRMEYPESVGALERKEIEALAQSYLSRTQPRRVLGRPRFVDKMLGNFGHLGLLHLMFPRAAIIDARRHPLGGGFSCFKQQFARGHVYSYDLLELGRYIRDYVGWMEHFDTVLPRRVHRVYYERFIADPEGELRRLLDYCGLPFEAECLRFHANTRIVQTISSEQVRRPLYTESVDQWRRYEPWLGPLQAALGDLVDRYPVVSRSSP